MSYEKGKTAVSTNNNNNVVEEIRTLKRIEAMLERASELHHLAMVEPRHKVAERLSERAEELEASAWALLATVV